jgi:hypothetical protein
MWDYAIFDTQTGTRLSPVFPSASAWGRVMNTIGSERQTVFELADTVNAQLDYESLTTPWSRTLVTLYNGAVRDAQIITDSDLDRDNKRLTINHSPFRLILTKRYPFGVNSYWADESAHKPGVFTASAVEYRSIISQALTLGITGPYSSYALPIVVPPIVAGTHGLTRGNWTFQTVDALMSDQQSASGGPDVDFEPRLNGAGKLEYLVRAGTDAVPAITDALYEFHMNVTQPALTNVHKKVDGNGQVTGVFTIGEGSEEDMLVAGRGLGAASPIPALDVTQRAKLLGDQPFLASQSDSSLALNRYATAQWSMRFVADADPKQDLAMIRIGSILRLHFDHDFWEPDGYQDLRVIGLEGDMSNIITPTLQAVVNA